MIGGLVARHALSKDVVQGVSERTGGVPLFVEEVTRLLLERGVEGGAQAIPPTLQQSLAARLDRLGDARVADKAVVPLLYEGREVGVDVDESQIDRWFEVHTRGLSDEQRADLKRKMSRAREIEGIESRLKYIALSTSVSTSPQTSKGPASRGSWLHPGSELRSS